MAAATANSFILLASLSSCSCFQLASNFEPEPAPTRWTNCSAPGCPPTADARGGETTEQTVAGQKPWKSWNHCRLRHAMDSIGKRNVTFTVLGGSATAGAGLPVGQLNWFKHLERMVSHSMTGAKFKNAAQGGAESFWGASLMDSVVGDTDVLLWEYAINDFKGSSTGYPEESPESMRKGIEFFIRRGLQLPSRPALVFVYLYDAATHYDTFHSTALSYQNIVLQQFADAGVDIIVVPVSESLRFIGAQTEMNDHHPGPRGHEAISQSVWKEMRWAAAEAHESCSPEEYKAAASAADIPEGSDFAKDNFLHALQQMRSVSGTPVQPRFGKSNFSTDACELGEATLENFTNCSEVVMDIFGKGEPGRADRKIGYDIPPCAGNRILRIRMGGLAEGDSSGFIGMHVGGGKDARNEWPHTIRIRIDGHQPAEFTPRSAVNRFGAVFNLWIPLNLSAARRTTSQELALALCMPEDNVTGNWQESFWSPFHNGGGRVDWITVFVGA